MDVNTKKTILEILDKHPEGLTITSIASISGLHRHTITKYIKDLILSDKVQERSVGIAKLCYSTKYKSNIGFSEKIKTGQTQIIPIIFLLLLIPVLIIAQNITNSDVNITGDFSEVIDTSNINSSSNLPETTTIIQDTDLSTVTTIENEENILNSSEESTVITTTDITIKTIGSTIITNETGDQKNEATTSQTTSSAALSEEKLNVNIELPEKITRKNSIRLKASVVNMFSDNKTISLRWVLPSGFSLESDNEIYECGIVEPNNSCVSEISVFVSETAELGKNQIKVVVDYE